MNKFKVGDKVIVKSTISTTNEVVEITDIENRLILDNNCTFYLCSDGIRYI